MKLGEHVSLRLLFVTSLIPGKNPSTGYELANAAVLDGLARAGCEVTIIGCTWPGQPIERRPNTFVLDEVEVRTEKAGLWRKLYWLGLSFLLRSPMTCAKLRAIPRRKLEDALRECGNFDGYVLNGISLPGAFSEHFADKPSIFIAHNVEHLSSAENAVHSTSFLMRALFFRDSRLLKKLEDMLCSRAAVTVTFAKEDGADLGLSPDRYVVLPLNIPDVVAAPPKQALKYDIALLGTWSWQPNRIGLDWFLKSVKPALAPGTRIAVAGSGMSEAKASWPDVDFVGRVENARDFITSCAVVPLISRAGTGVQLKTIETFSLGMPSVGTTSSVRGIATLPANCTLADEPADFARALNEKIERARSGDLQRIDSISFAKEQEALMDRQIARLLASFGRALKP